MVVVQRRGSIDNLWAASQSVQQVIASSASAARAASAAMSTRFGTLLVLSTAECAAACRKAHPLRSALCALSNSKGSVKKNIFVFFLFVPPSSCSDQHQLQALL